MKALQISGEVTKWLLAVVVLVVATLALSQLTGRPWYEALFISIWVAWLSSRRPSSRQSGSHGMAVGAEPNASTAFPTFSKIGRFIRPIFPTIRKIFVGLFVAMIIAVSLWLMMTLLRWFWVHPLFK